MPAQDPCVSPSEQERHIEDHMVAVCVHLEDKAKDKDKDKCNVKDKDKETNAMSTTSFWLSLVVYSCHLFDIRQEEHGPNEPVVI